MLAVLDPRLKTMGYGRRFLASLPPAPVTHDVLDIARFFKEYGADDVDDDPADDPLMTTSSPSPEVAAVVRPILKWAGGKRQLLPALRPYYPSTFGRYIEPFLGSGAVFLDCHNRGLLDSCEVHLSDINADVIGCYRMVRDEVEAVIEALRTLDAGHRADGTRHFYAVRDEQFNALRRDIHAAPDPAKAYTPALAAMLIYLNRTGYNGLFRLNSRGGFNVPVGRYARVTICDAPNLRRLSAALRRPGLTVEVRRFEEALGDGRPGDFVLPGSPVRAGQPHGPVHLLHRGEVRSGRAGAAAADRGRLARLGARGTAE